MIFQTDSQLFEAVVESIQELRRWPASMGWALPEPSADVSETYCRQAAAAFAERTDFPLLLILRETGAIVGSSGLHRPDWSVPKMEIGWWGRTSTSGQGLVSEGVSAILDFGFSVLGARRIFALPDELNRPSRRICERVGMEFEGVVRNERAEPSGVLRNSCLYSAIRA